MGEGLLWGGRHWDTESAPEWATTWRVTSEWRGGGRSWRAGLASSHLSSFRRGRWTWRWRHNETTSSSSLQYVLTTVTRRSLARFCTDEKTQSEQVVQTSFRSPLQDATTFPAVPRATGPLAVYCQSFPKIPVSVSRNLLHHHHHRHHHRRV